jgi:hypothetical protein
MKILPLKTGFEYDVLTKARHNYCYTSKAGTCKKAKKQYNRRVRKHLKAMAHDSV